jgi:subtilase family serine protease
VKTFFSKKNVYLYGVPILGAVVVIVFGGVSSLLAAPGKFERRVSIPGLSSRMIKQHIPLHATDDSEQLEISVALNIRNADELDRLIAAQNDPQSPLYHHYITPRDFTETFGPEQRTVDRVVAYLRSQNLEVKSVSSNRVLIHAVGTVADVERAFAVNLADYKYEGRMVYAPTSEPSVPEALAGTILNVSGLDNVALYKRVSRSSEINLHPHRGPDGGYTPAELRGAYNIAPLTDNHYDGTGQTVALFELDGYKPSDINAFLDYHNLGEPKYSDVLVDGAKNVPGANAIEVELDMEILSGIAPGATQKVYIGRNSIVGVNNLYNRIVNDNLAKVVSISWGLCEPAVGESQLKTLNTIFKQGIAQGQAFFAASGDAGAYDCGDSELAVDSPASDPNVVSVGGTKLKSENGNYNSEVAWSCPSCTQLGENGAGSGGGLSAFFERPDYQSGPNIEFTKRAVPDVAAVADPRSGYSIYCTVEGVHCPSTGWLTVGGTSAAAPLWAGIAASVNQYLESQQAPTLGSASALLYKLYNTEQPYPSYHDIVRGSNLYYEAEEGYDQATGVGTPDAWNIARNLATIAQTGSGNEDDSSLQEVSSGDFGVIGYHPSRP